jgi:hypothetical protein
MKGSVIRIATGMSVVAVLTMVIAVPASAAVTPLTAPRVNIAAPTGGDYMRRGTAIIIGEACDPDATLTDATAGISRITAYVGDRDTVEGVPSWRPGGFIGSATSTRPAADSPFAQGSRLGLANIDVSFCRQLNAGFRIITSALRKGSWNLNVYVQANNGKETKVTISGLRVDTP